MKDSSVHKIDTPVLVRQTCQLKSDNEFWSNAVVIPIGCSNLHFASKALFVSLAMRFAASQTRICTEWDFV
jgi:hypothetical protein